MPTDFIKYMEFAGRRINFTLDEVADLKRFGPVGLNVIAFKSLEYLKEKHHIRPAQFLYPNEVDVRGSTKLFIALLTKCLEKRVMAICQYIPRENIAPKLVALVPQTEVVGDQGQQLTPAGFHIIFFPYVVCYFHHNSILAGINCSSLICRSNHFQICGGLSHE